MCNWIWENFSQIWGVFSFQVFNSHLQIHAWRWLANWVRWNWTSFWFIVVCILKKCTWLCTKCGTGHIAYKSIRSYATTCSTGGMALTYLIAIIFLNSLVYIFSDFQDNWNNPLGTLDFKSSQYSNLCFYLLRSISTVILRKFFLLHIYSLVGMG